MKQFTDNNMKSRLDTQLPVSVYFDDLIFQREMEVFFRNGLRYVGHELMVPEPGCFQTLPIENHARVLLRDQHSVRLMSNICRHRQAIMLKGSGQLPSNGNIVCPLHRWTYDEKGELIGAPYFSEQPCTRLRDFPISSWNGLLFEESGSAEVLEECKQMQAAEHFNFEGYRLSHIETHVCDYNWKTFIEVYLEDYHVVPFHPGLGRFVSCDDLVWEFGKNFSVQTVGIWDELSKPGSEVYKRWHEQVKSQHAGQLPEKGAVWLTIYPNIMVEWYPKVLVISTLHPLGPQKTINMVEFYYPEEIALFEPDYVAAQKAAYMETCLEDDEIALRMDEGRKALYNNQRNEAGPYQSPMEDGMQHFHQFYRLAMGDL